jgi:hypothetical protein
MSLSISRLEMEDLHTYEVSFSYPVAQEEGFGDPSTPDAEEVRVCSDQRSTGLDGDVIALVALLLAGPIQVTSQYVYDRYFKPREPQSNPSQDVERNVPKAIAGDRVYRIGSRSDVETMIAENQVER